MASILKRGDSWRAFVRRKGCTPISKTFVTKGMAATWANRIERELEQRAASGTTDADFLTVRQCIEWYTDPDRQFAQWGRTKTKDLARLLSFDIADRVAAELQAPDFIKHIEARRRMGAGAATAGNDLVWLRQVLRAARTSLRIPINLQDLDDAAADLRRRRVIQKSRARDRRLLKDEERALLEHFASRDRRARIPMAEIMRFALATSRREEEITRVLWRDVEWDKGIAWLGDVKHPRHKVGNRRAFRLSQEARAILQRQPRTSAWAFPYNPKSIGSAFTNACKFLGITNLRFHDLRHEAISRLFEKGYAIHEVAQFSLHESWASLKRYTHLRPENVPDK